MTKSMLFGFLWMILLPLQAAGQGALVLNVRVVDGSGSELPALVTTATGLPNIYNAAGAFFDFAAESILSGSVDFSDDSCLFNITYEDNEPHYYVSNEGPVFTAFGTGFTRAAGVYTVNQATICDNFCYLDVNDDNPKRFWIMNNFGPMDVVLIDADTDSELVGFRCFGASACRGTATSFNIRNDVFDPVGSVKIEVSGPPGFGSTSRMENVAPYTAFGDRSGDYSGKSFPSGVYTITATAFTERNGGGTASQTLTYTRFI